MWFQTIRTGQRAAIWDQQGRVKMLDGPTRFFRTTQAVQMLPQFTAEPDQYLAIQFKDGRRQHLRGPATVWLDPVAHETVIVHDAIYINTNEAIVVYVQDNGQVQRKIINGPALHVPAENEWIHEFRWHGTDSKEPRRRRHSTTWRRTSSS